MSPESSRQPSGEGHQGGEAAWKAHKEAVAGRNAQVRKLGTQRRQEREGRQAAELRAAERLEMAELAKRKR